VAVNPSTVKSRAGDVVFDVVHRSLGLATGWF
jgi:hypothetical protein